ncbi:hypothetical protein [Paenibacillus agricola]|uniref:Uncharacterized protein n=1 Tax=Paenibacillus agricola TaxID=2716264 RepID=A0ABX0JHL9_9BACL|nr:hypothetical protein [Paenibacillus agricola]NHN34804.1 hypothetical protein [Paenibacillus agricola]
MYFTNDVHLENYAAIQRALNINPSRYEYLAVAYVLAYPDIYQNIEWSAFQITRKFEGQHAFDFPSLSGGSVQ